MKRIELKRVSASSKVTLGVLVDTDTGLPFMLTLELPDKGNQQSISCIPKGTYACKPYSSEKYTDVYQVTDVPGRTHILIHAGNTTENTYGCILPGKVFGSISDKPAVFQSGDSLKALKKLIGKEDFELIIS